MITKGRGLFAGGILAGALLLGTAGLAVAQNPNLTPTPAWDGVGMSGHGVAGMMTPDLFAQMNVMHDQVVASGSAGMAQMNVMHDQVVASGSAGMAQMNVMHDQVVASGSAGMAQMNVMHDQPRMNR